MMDGQTKIKSTNIIITIVVGAVVVTEDGGDGVATLNCHSDNYADVILCRL